MSNYTKTTNFASKDNLSPGNPLKIVKGTEIDTEFNNIQTAVATKTDNSAAAITGGSITGITDLAVADGGTGASTAAGGLNNLLPTQTGNANKYLQTDGTNATWDAVTLSTADITGTLAVANGGTGVTSSTGTGNVVLSNSPTLVTPALGTPASGTLTNATGLPISTGVSGLGTGVATFLGTPSSANLASAVSDETGSGALVFANSPTLVTPALGTPSALVGTNITGTASGLTAGNVTTNANLTGAVTSVGNATSLGSFTSAQLLGALSDETGTGSAVFATSPTLVTPILGTPTSATLTNATGLPISTGVSGLGTGVATFLATPSSANLAAALTDETGSGANVFATSPTLVTPILGTPTSATLTNATGLPLTTGVTGTLPTANGGTNLTSFTANGVVYASSSSALATGSGLQFNGTNLTNTTGYISTATDFRFNGWSYSRIAITDGGGGFVGGYNITYSGGGVVYDSTGLISGIYNSTGGNIRFYAGGSASAGTAAPEGMRLTSTGLGIGTSSPAYKLDVSGTMGVSGVSTFSAGTAALPALTTTGDTNTGIYFPAADTIAFSEGGVEAARITSSGNLLVGTTTDEGERTRFESTSAAQLSLVYTGIGKFVFKVDSSRNLSILDGTNERVRITSAGNFLVGTTSVFSNARVTVSTSATDGIASTQGTAGGYCFLANALTNGGTFYHASFGENGTQRGSITSNGTVTVYNTTSDYRLKNNQAPLTGSGAFIDALQPKTWTWAQDGAKGVGFIAHEFAEVSPSSVTGAKDAIDAEGNPVHQVMQASSAEVIANLVAEIQSLRQRVAQLETN